MLATIASLPRVPANETERLRTLGYYDLLRSLRESVFDEFVSLAARIFELPMSLLGLVEADQVIYKANYGLAGLRQQPRPEAICAQLVAEGTPLIFTDLTQATSAHLSRHARAAALAKGLRFYAAAPLRMANQTTIGTLCVLDWQPRSFGEAEQHVLEQLAQLVERVIIVRHACLTSAWLGREYWQATQEYIADALRQTHRLAPAATISLPTPASRLLPIVRHLNELAWVLAEPLPGFA